MNFYVLTLFPEMISQAASYSILGRAQTEGVLSVNPVNIRDFAHNKHLHVDDAPFGGGAGRVMPFSFILSYTFAMIVIPFLS